MAQNKSEQPPRVTQRLTQALKYLTMARTSRELDYGAVPYVLAAETLIAIALERQKGERTKR